MRMSDALQEFAPIIRKRESLKRKISMVKKMRHFYVLLVPILLYFIFFHYKPMYGLIIAFKDFRILDGINGSPWVGFKHFDQLFGSPLFYRVFMNTIIISGQRLLFGFPAPIILALLFNELRSTRAKKAFQTISYLPYFISWVVLGGMFRELFSPSTGVVNYIITFFGGKSQYFLAEPSLFRPVLIITGIWQTVGWGSVVYLAAIAGINVEQYESAIIDGAGRFQQALRITLPSLYPIMTIMFLLNLGQILNAGFDQIFNMYNPMVYNVADIIDTYVYRVGLINTDYSFATAVGLFKNIIGFTLVIIVNKLSKKFTDSSLW
jgi:putative aldouronate transport system permease protein